MNFYNLTSRYIKHTKRSVIKFNKIFYSSSKNDNNKNNDENKTKIETDLVFKADHEIQERPKPVKIPAVDEPKDAFNLIKTSFHNLVNLKTPNTIPLECEILIIGGGIIGAFVAYFLSKTYSKLNIVVVERDFNYTQSSTFWSVGGFRQQFSLVENIRMSLFGSEFLRSSSESLNIENSIEGDDIDLNINHDGYLFLATKRTSQRMIENHKIQLSQGAKVKLLNSNELKGNFNWINTDDIELASYGYMNEGWVDARKYLKAVKTKAESFGVHFVKGELIGFENSKLNYPFQKLQRGLVDTFDGKIIPIQFQNFVNAAGPWAADVSRLAGIGVVGENDEDDDSFNALHVPLPVEPRKRYIYLFEAENGPIFNVPLTIDHTGVFFRRYGNTNQYICGLNQNEESEPKNLNLGDIDYEYFIQNIKPVLVKRVPSFSNLKLLQAWSGYYDYNTFDQNLIIGRHNIHKNFIFANGSSGHGLQHAAAIGRAVSELILDGKYKTIDLSRFSFDRVVYDIPVKEIDVI